MSKLIIGDPHITELSIPELEKTFTEILKQKADELIMLGDLYHYRKPTAQEILFGTKNADQFKHTFKKVIFLRGNHDRTKDISAVDYLKYLGIEIVDEYIDENNNYYGHFMTNKSLYEYGSYQKTVKQLSKYNKVFLGHQHSFQEIETDKMFHTGSIRFVNFNEAIDPFKRFILLSDNQVQYIKLNSPIPMKDVKSVKELSNLLDGYFCKKCLLPISGDCRYTNNICVFCHHNTMEWDSNGQLITKGEAIEQGYKTPLKVRVVLSNFQQFKNEINDISKFKDKFLDFKIKLEFDKIEVSKTIAPLKQYKNKNLKQILKEGISKVKDEDVRKLLTEQMEEIK